MTRERMRQFGYMIKARAPFLARAVFSDESAQFLNPPEPNPGDSVHIRLRTAADNVDEVTLLIEGAEVQMRRAKRSGAFDYYEAIIKASSKKMSYCFRIGVGSFVYYYNRLGLSRELSADGAFSFVPGFSVPDWAKGAVMYQIFVERFCNGDPANDVLTDEYSYIERHVQRVKDWNATPSELDVCNFYGGDLQGVIDKLDYLAELGIEAIYLNPIFVSPSNHKYDAQDYDHIDPHFGVIRQEQEGLLEADDHDNTHAARYVSRVTGLSNLEASDALFAKLVKKAHKRGIRVILDGVFNHCGSFHKWMDRERIYEGHEGFAKGAWVDKASPYRAYFRFKEDADEQYEGWWDFETLPKLNYEESEALQEEIFRIAEKWLSPPYNADGWRLDVAADLGHSETFNHEFWRKFRKRVRKVNPDALIIAEHYGDPSAWLSGGEWDSVMNYDAFMEPVSWFLTGMEKHSDAYNEELQGNDVFLRDSILRAMARLPRPSLLAAMNELDNHDHSRFLTRTNHQVGRLASLGAAAAGADVDKAVLREAVIWQMTWPGAPTVYYGDEAGLCGFTDPDSRRTYPWGKEDQKLLRFYHEAIALHKRHSMLRTASLAILYLAPHILAYARFDEKEQIVVALNNRDEEAEIALPVWIAGVKKRGTCEMMRILRSDRKSFSTSEKIAKVKNGELRVTMPAKGAAVWFGLQSGKK